MPNCTFSIRYIPSHIRDLSARYPGRVAFDEFHLGLAEHDVSPVAIVKLLLFGSWRWAAAQAALVGVLALFGMRRRRRFLKALMLVGVLAMLPMLGGCGSRCKNFGTEPANYTFSVTATSMGSPAQSLAQAVTMKVHL